MWNKTTDIIDLPGHPVLVCLTGFLMEYTLIGRVGYHVKFRIPNRP